jgi:serine/threonine protein kinase
MEKIEGIKLSQFLTLHSHLSLDILVKIYFQLLSAVNFCHKKGIVHNSIHPDNILIINKKHEYYLKLIDFS